MKGITRILPMNDNVFDAARLREMHAITQTDIQFTFGNFQQAAKEAVMDLTGQQAVGDVYYVGPYKSEQENGTANLFDDERRDKAVARWLGKMRRTMSDAVHGAMFDDEVGERTRRWLKR